MKKYFNQLEEKRWLYIPAGLLVINVLIWSVVLVATPKSRLTVSFLDVGQGDAALITSPNGNQLLIDGGPNKSVLRQLGREMSFHDRTIDAVIATHPDKDHVGGLPEVLRRFEVGVILEPGSESDTAIYEEFQSGVEQEEAARILARRGMVIDFGDGVYFDILFPDRDVSGMESNASSIIGRLVYGETEFLLTGDSPTGIEDYLVSIYGSNLESDVLKAGHHGSRTSTGLSFASVVSPQYAVISAGKDNSYGHPHPEVLETLRSLDARVLNTGEEGTITFYSDGKVVKEE